MRKTSDDKNKNIIQFLKQFKNFLTAPIFDIISNEIKKEI